MNERICKIVGPIFIITSVLIPVFILIQSAGELRQFENMIVQQLEPWEIKEISFTYPVLLGVSYSLLASGSVFYFGKRSFLKKPRPGSTLLLTSVILGAFWWAFLFSAAIMSLAVHPGVVFFFFIVGPMLWFLSLVGFLGWGKKTLGENVFTWAMELFAVSLISAFLSPLLHPLTIILALFLALLGFVGLIFALAAWDRVKKRKSALRYSMIGGVLMLLHPFSLFIFPAIPGILCIIGGIRSRKSLNVA